ncbi:uncharacterized protein LOC123543789 [Mercenaria mercenaria]|uniref:uncharacterized protein LOC123543789 n=1 Tax=Mercenaria mercenaria TaxID=6596 RepID=UPI00234E3A09|nr:uncharacterized protein LOC123543789 [Mercenaria mercenaria]
MAGFERLCKESPDGSMASGYSPGMNVASSHNQKDSNCNLDSDTLLCDPCKFDETKEQAVGFCSVCLEYLCNSCIKEHKKAKMTRGHRVILQEIQTNAAAFKEIRKLIICPFHADMNIVYRCDDHDVLACISCKAETHRKCENVYEIGKSNGSDTVLKDVLDSLREIEEASRNVQKAKKENIDHLYQEQSKILYETKTYCEEIINTVKEHEVKIENETKEKIELAVSEVKKDLDESTRLAEEGENSKNMVEAVLKYMANDTAVIIAHQLNSKAQQVRSNIDKLSKNHLSVHLVKDQNVSDFPKLGTLFIKHHKKPDAEEKQVLPQEYHVIENSSDAVLDSRETSPFTDACKIKTATVKNERTKVKSSLERRVTYQNQYCVESNDSKFCSVLGSVIFPDGQLLIIDIDNSKLKLLSEQFVLQSTLRLPGKPVRVCAIDSDSVAVSFESVKRINRYRIFSSEIIYEGGFKTDLYNFGIAYNGVNIVALMSNRHYGTENNAYEDIIEIQVMDVTNGSVLETISNLRKVNNMKYVLRDIQALHVNERNELIVAEANGVTCFAISKGKRQTIATAKTWYTCHGVIEKNSIENITSDKDSVYVCVRNGTILQMAIEDYRINRVIISNIGSSARTVSVDNERDCIVVGCFNDDYIHVFSFK